MNELPIHSVKTMSKPLLDPVSAQVVIQQASANTGLSSSTVARYRQAKERYEVAKAQAIHDLAINPNLNPQQMMNAMVHIQEMHKKITEFTEDIAKNSNTVITSNDAVTMRQMRAEGATDAKIAEWFDTNPTKINRAINSA